MLHPSGLEDVVAVLNNMVSDGVIDGYAIGGAVAAIFFGEATFTRDLDVFVVLEVEGVLLSLSPIYSWLARHKFTFSGDAVNIHGVPVQFLASSSPMADEAIAKAATFDIGRETARVIQPEYLVAMWLEGSAYNSKRRARAAHMIEQGLVDKTKGRRILERFKISRRGLL